MELFTKSLYLLSFWDWAKSFVIDVFFDKNKQGRENENTPI